MRLKKLWLFSCFFYCLSGFAQPILFISEVGGQADLYLVEEDGTGLKRLTDNPDYELQAAVSLGGEKIAYAASPFINGQFANPQIYLIDFKGGPITQLTHNGARNFSPTFSPDGQKIAFSSLDETYNADIFIIDVDGNNLKRMTTSPLFEANPSWGNRGAVLLYQEEKDGLGRLMTMSAQGIAPLANQEDGFAFSPSWGPRDESIIYGIAQQGALGTVFVLADPTGKTLHKLEGKFVKSHPSISDEGTKIVYEQVKTERSGIFICDLSGENEREVGLSENHNFAPVWVNQKTAPVKKQVSLPVSSTSIQINDDLGTVIYITPAELPEKVVSLSPAITEIIFALGENRRLKGVTLRSEYPRQAKLIPLVGSYNSPDWDKIKKIQPQYIFLSSALQEKFAAQIKELGAIPVLFKAANFEEVYSSYKKISLILTGSAKAGDELILSVKKEIAAIEKIVAQVKTPKRVYLEINGPQNLFTIGRGSFMNELLTKANVLNVFGQRSEGYPQITDQEILTANPEVAIIDHPLQFKVGVKKRVGWGNIQAVKDDKVYDAQDFDVAVLDRPGPRLAQAVRIIAELAYPELFGH